MQVTKPAVCASLRTDCGDFRTQERHIPTFVPQLACAEASAAAARAPFARYLPIPKVVESRGGHGALSVLWVSRRFRPGPQSGSHTSVSRPLLVEPDVLNCRIRLSDGIMSLPTEGP